MLQGGCRDPAGRRRGSPWHGRYGQEITVKGRGLPKRGSSQKGDLIVTTRVVLPKLDEDARADFERVLKKHPQPNPRKPN